MEDQGFLLNLPSSIYNVWWTGPESNWRHTAFQAVALPTELPVQKFPNLVSRFAESKFVKLLGPAIFLGGSKTYRLSYSAKQQRDPLIRFTRSRLSAGFSISARN